MADDVPPPPPKVVTVPTDRLWLDPRFMLAATKAYFNDVIVAAGVIVPLCPADPTRVAVGFGFPPLAGLGISISPWPDPDKFSFFQSNQTTVYWSDTRSNLLLPTFAWFAFSTGNLSVRVTTVTRTT